MARSARDNLKPVVLKTAANKIKTVRSEERAARLETAPTAAQLVEAAASSPAATPEIIFSSLKSFNDFFYGPLLEQRSKPREEPFLFRFDFRMFQEIQANPKQRKHLLELIAYIFQFGGWEETAITVETSGNRQRRLTVDTWPSLKDEIFQKVLRPSKAQQQMDEVRYTRHRIATSLEQARARLRELNRLHAQAKAAQAQSSPREEKTEKSTCSQIARTGSTLPPSHAVFKNKSYLPTLHKKAPQFKRELRSKDNSASPAVTATKSG